MSVDETLLKDKMLVKIIDTPLDTPSFLLRAPSLWVGCPKFTKCKIVKMPETETSLNWAWKCDMPSTAMHSFWLKLVVKCVLQIYCGKRFLQFQTTVCGQSTLAQPAPQGVIWSVCNTPHPLPASRPVLPYD